MKKFILLWSLLTSNFALSDVGSQLEKSDKYIIIARHGQTDYNVKGLLTGRGSNPDLNEEGKNQAYILGRKLVNDFSGDLKIELIVSSNMKRTNQTASIINESLSLPLIYNINLQEVDRGTLEGKPLTEVLPIIDSIPDHYAHPIHGGESTKSFRSRVTEGICQYYHSPEKVILIVAHGFVGETANHYFKDEAVKLKNTDYIILTESDLRDKCPKA